MVPLTPLTSENYTSPIFFLIFHCWHRWRLKKHEEWYFKRDTGLIADGAIDTVYIKKLFINFFFLVFHRWHRWRLKKHEEKYFKRDTDLIADVAVDTVDIKKLSINHFFSCISSLTLLTSEKIWREIFQKRYWFNCWWCRWHCWHQKIDTSANLFFSFWLMTPLMPQRSFELKHILSFLLIHTVQILIWMFSALR